MQVMIVLEEKRKLSQEVRVTVLAEKKDIEMRNSDV